MKKYGIYFSLLGFSLLMGIKFFQPELAHEVKTQVIEAIDSNVNYEDLLETLGREYAERGLRQELSEVLRVDNRPEASAPNSPPAAAPSDHIPSSQPPEDDLAENCP